MGGGGGGVGGGRVGEAEEEKPRIMNHANESAHMENGRKKRFQKGKRRSTFILAVRNLH